MRRPVSSARTPTAPRFTCVARACLTDDAFSSERRSIARAQAYVSERGGVAFFDRPDWQTELRQALPDRHGEFESAEDQIRAIDDELDRCHAELSSRLGTNSVRHLALPWGIAGTLTSVRSRRSRDRDGLPGTDVRSPGRATRRRSVPADAPQRQVHPVPSWTGTPAFPFAGLAQ